MANKKVTYSIFNNGGYSSFKKVLKFERAIINKTNKIPSFLENKKDDLIFVFKTFFNSSISNNLKECAFITFLKDNMPECSHFVIGDYGYGLNNNYKDILIDKEHMAKLNTVLSRYGYGIKEKDFVWFNLDDFKWFLSLKEKGTKFNAKKDVAELYEIKNKIYSAPSKSLEINVPLDIKLEAYRTENLLKCNVYEKSMQNLLDELGINYIPQKIIYADGSCYILDFYLEDYKIDIETDGGYHDLEEQLIKDRERTNKLAKNGILVLRFKNYEISEMIEDVKSCICDLIGYKTVQYKKP